jgi:hypothetical protein
MLVLSTELQILRCKYEGGSKTLLAGSGSANESEGAAAPRAGEPRGLRWAATEQIFSQLKSSKDGAVERARERAAKEGALERERFLDPPVDGRLAAVVVRRQRRTDRRTVDVNFISARCPSKCERAVAECGGDGGRLCILNVVMRQ